MIDEIKYEEYSDDMEETLSDVMDDWKELSAKQKERMKAKHTIYKTILKHDSGFFGNNLFRFLIVIAGIISVFGAISLSLYMKDNNKFGKIVLFIGLGIACAFTVYKLIKYIGKKIALSKIYKGLFLLKKDISKNARTLQVFKKYHTRLSQLKNKFTKNLSEKNANELYDKFNAVYENFTNNKLIKALNG